MSEENKEKKVDSGWKEQAQKEKEELDKKPHEEGCGCDDKFAPPPDFNTLVYTLALQALISLGQMEHPASHKKEVDLIQARYNIDTLEMLKAKTVNNLTKEEAPHLEQTLYALQMLFVRVSQEPNPTPAPAPTPDAEPDKKK
ncbi:MAG: DUF1844 domain-containing protein [Candidatus Brocadiia bacterium]